MNNIKKRKMTARHGWFYRLVKGVLYTFVFAFIGGTAAATALVIYASSTVDYAADEEMFLSAAENRTTRFYYNDTRNGSDGTSPVSVSGYYAAEWKEERLSPSLSGFYVDFEKIPQCVKDAAVAAEDHRFYEHNGVDVFRTAKAVLNAIFHFESRFGGSTVTQQLIKNLSGDTEETPLRKIREILRAIHIEKNHGKDEILALYLNILPLSRGTTGVAMGAEKYFGKSVSDLNTAEAASLIAITNAPALYDPLTHPEENAARRQMILGQMKKYGYLDDNGYQDAMETAVFAVEKNENRRKVMDWYTEAVLNDIVNDLISEKNWSEAKAEAVVYGGGLTVYTQVNKEMQDTLEKYFLNLSHFEDAAHLRYAMTIVDPKTGDLLATVGDTGKKSGSRVLDYATGVEVPPGSALKPLSVYGPALESGVINWSTVLDDSPVTVSGDKVWPQNANRVYSGRITAADALIQSKNTVAVKVLTKLGKENSYRYLTETLGLRGLIERKTSGERTLTDIAEAPLALGQLTYGVTLRDLTTAYTVFADGGNVHSPRSYCLVLDKNGDVLLKKETETKKAMSEENAAIMTEMLRCVVSDGTGKASALNKTVSLAGKTGTSGIGENRFFIGYTPYLLAGIYCGSRDGKTATALSFSGHIRVYDDVMRAMHAFYLVKNRKLDGFVLPDGVTQASFCQDSGEKPSLACGGDMRGNRVKTGFFLAGDEPREKCSCHVSVIYDSEGKGIATRHCVTPENLESLTEVSLVKPLKRNLPESVSVEDEVYMLPDSETEKEKRFCPICPLHENFPHFSDVDLE